ncbi:hypothetical protein, partial [Salmonella sp. s54395]|uniref:hypothetical protein n=1 Tax=Salmonella sp. s54395 TaxID=3159664 RepID=UPI003980F88B
VSEVAEVVEVIHIKRIHTVVAMEEIVTDAEAVEAMVVADMTATAVVATTAQKAMVIPATIRVAEEVVAVVAADTGRTRDCFFGVV